jgi:hypothetical protein
LAAFDYSASVPGETKLGARISIGSFGTNADSYMAYSDMTGAMYVTSSLGGNRLARVNGITGLHSPYTEPFCPDNPEIQPSPGYYDDVNAIATITQLPDGMIRGIDVLGHTEEIIMIYYFGLIKTTLVFLRGGDLYSVEVPLSFSGARFVEPKF